MRLKRGRLFLQSVNRSFINAIQGNIAHTAGDGLLVHFPCITGAVQSAIEIQEHLAKHNSSIRQKISVCTITTVTRPTDATPIHATHF